MKNEIKRLMSMLLALLMFASILPSSAYAEESPVALVVESAVSNEPEELSDADAISDKTPVATDASAAPDKSEIDTAVKAENTRTVRVNIVFICAQERTQITVKKGDSVVAPVEDHHYSLEPGEYTYDAVCEGYESAMGVGFTVQDDDLKITVTLETLPLLAEDEEEAELLPEETDMTEEREESAVTESSAETEPDDGNCEYFASFGGDASEGDTFSSGFALMSMDPLVSAVDSSGTDFDDSAYYSISWGNVVFPAEETTWWGSGEIGGWGRIFDAVDLRNLGQTSYANVQELVQNLGAPADAFWWYGWVDENGKWNGHISGYPTVTNTVTGETVNVVRWESSICAIMSVSGYSSSIPTWKVTAEGSVIDVDTISPEARDEIGYLYNKSIGFTGQRGMQVRLYLSDGNSVLLSYGRGDSYDAPFVTNAKGTVTGYLARIKNAGESENIGNIVSAMGYLRAPSAQKEYHFVVEKTVSGVADDAVYTFPVKVSINGGAEIIIEIDTVGNGTFSKEVTFTAYPGTYTITAREDHDDMPADIEIVNGEATAVAVESAVEIDETSTLSVENKVKELHVTYVAKSDPEYGSPADSVTPVDSTTYKYNDTVIVADNLTSTQGYAIVDSKKIPGTWTFTPWNKENFKITEDTTITGIWTFTPDTYTVTYVVNGDSTYGTPTDGTAPEDENNPYDYNADVIVKASLTTEWTTSDGTAGGVPGTWTFTPWDKGNFKIIEDTTITGSWTFTPAPPALTYGNLTISKTVTGDLGDRTKYFSFTVTFDAVGNYSYTGSKRGTLSSGDTIQLKHGEYVTIIDLPAGTQYSVTESGNTGYRVYVSGGVGVIAEGKTSSAQFTNIKSKVPITGDNSNLGLWMAIMSFSLLGAVGTIIYGRKKRKKPAHLNNR